MKIHEENVELHEYIEDKQMRIEELEDENKEKDDEIIDLNKDNDNQRLEIQRLRINLANKEREHNLLKTRFENLKRKYEPNVIRFPFNQNKRTRFWNP